MRKNQLMRAKLYAIKTKLTEARVPWAIFAGSAAHCYGSKRKITDIDILVRCEDLKKAKTALKDVNMRSFDIGCGAEIPTPQGTCPFFLDEDMIERTQWRTLFGILVPVMSPEDNIVLKAILQRGPEQGKHDIEDIKDILKNESIDLAYLQARICKCHAEERVNPLLRSLKSQ